MNHISSDHWRAYQEIAPPEKHRQSKAETFTVVGTNETKVKMLFQKLENVAIVDSVTNEQ